MRKTAVIFGIIASIAMGVKSADAQVGVSVQIGIAPPVLPVYVQPVCPAPGYIWTPGYWAYGPYGYYWVPGVWVLAPEVGFLWTPGYWGFVGGYYHWYHGYWGPHVGFYGGVNYGYGYDGRGFYGGRWVGGAYQYNTAVTRVNTTVIHTTYVDRTVVNAPANHASFNGPRGVTATPTSADEATMRENHIQPTSAQVSHEETASRDRSELASVNKGHPATAAMSKVGGQKYNASGHTAGSAASHRTTTGAHNAAHTNYSRTPQAHSTPQRSAPARQSAPSRSRASGRAPASHSAPAHRSAGRAPAQRRAPAPRATGGGHEGERK